MKTMPKRKIAVLITGTIEPKKKQNSEPSKMLLKI